MRLDLATWKEVEHYLQSRDDIIIPTGSTEQHGPMGLIGTDSLCAEAIAQGVAEETKTLVTPALTYSPAPFNVLFPGTISITAQTYEALVRDMVAGLVLQGFRKFYFLNGHGANLEPLHKIARSYEGYDVTDIRIRSWWDFESVNLLRKQYYGDWEGMHATPSEISITQTLYRIVETTEAAKPPQKLSAEFMKAHAGDKHGPPEEHRAQFPDGRVGSHSALARPEHGRELFEAAKREISDDLAAWLAKRS